MIQLFHTRLCFSRNDVGHGQNTCVKIEYQYLNGVNHMLKEIYWRDNKRIMYSSCPTSISYSPKRHQSREYSVDNLLNPKWNRQYDSVMKTKYLIHIKQINNRSTPTDLGLVTPFFSHDDHFMDYKISFNLILGNKLAVVILTSLLRIISATPYNFFTVPFPTENGV